MILTCGQYPLNNGSIKMFSILIILFSLLLGAVGITLFIRYIQKSQQIFLGYETSRRIIIKTSIMNGFAVNLSFLALELFLASVEKNHIWTIESILFTISIPVILNVVVTLGFLWRFAKSGARRTPIPEHAAHRFRSMPHTESGVRRTLFP